MQRLAGLGHRLGHLLEIAGLARSTYFHHLSHPEHVTRPDLESPIREIWRRTANGCGHRQVRMCLVREFGRRVSAKTVLRVMRRMGLRCRIRAANPWRRYSSYRGDSGGRVPDLLKRDFTAERPFAKLGTDVTEFKVAGGKAYLAPVYDMGSKEIVAWDISRSPDLEQQKRLLAMLAERLPAGAAPIPHPDMGWQYQHKWWRDRLGELGIRQSMSRKGNCLDNAATEQVFGHLKDEFHRGGDVRLVRTVQGRARRVHRALEHQATPDTARGTHPGGVPGCVPRGLRLYPNKQRPTIGAQFNSGSRVPFLFLGGSAPGFPFLFVFGPRMRATRMPRGSSAYPGPGNTWIRRDRYRMFLRTARVFHALRPPSWNHADE